MSNAAKAALREEILQKSREFFRAEPKKFNPGQDYIPVTAKVLDESDLSILVDSCLDAWLTAGRFSTDFERAIAAQFTRTNPGLFVNSGSSANLVAVSSLSSPALEKLGMKPLQPGDEVITVASGFPTTLNPILQNGWVPVFVDVDVMTLNATVDAVRAAQSPKTRAVVLAHTLGNAYRSDILADWCDKEGMFLVEDCCDALGATIGSRPLGSFGHFATCSFYPAHHITTGEGGAVISRNAALRKIAASFRDWGRDCWCEPGMDNTCGKRFEWQLGDLPYGYDHKYTYSHIGYNLKATDMQAALGISQLKKLPQFVATRRKNWQTLYDGVKSSPALRDKFIPIEPTPETNPSWFGFPILCEGIDRFGVTKFLEERKIGTRLLFGGHLLKQPAYKGIPHRIAGPLTNTERVVDDVFWIGVHAGLRPEHLEYMLEQLHEATRIVRS